MWSCVTICICVLVTVSASLTQTRSHTRMKKKTVNHMCAQTHTYTQTHTGTHTENHPQTPAACTHGPTHHSILMLSDCVSLLCLSLSSDDLDCFSYRKKRIGPFLHLIFYINQICCFMVPWEQHTFEKSNKPKLMQRWYYYLRPQVSQACNAV